MVQEVEAFGKIIEFPDGMSREDMHGFITKNRHKIDPNFKVANPEALDYAKGFAVGANKLMSGVGYLTEAAGADETGKAIRKFGDRGVDYWNKQMSLGGKKAAESQVFVDDPESITGLRLGDDAGKALLMGAAQSLPSMFAAALPGLAITKGIQALVSLGLAGGAGATIPLLAGTAAPVGMTSQVIARAPAAVGFGAAEGLVAGGTNAAGLKSSIEGMGDKELSKSPVYVALKAQHGADKARQLLADQASSDLFGKTAVSTGTIGALTGGGALSSAYQKATTGAADGILMTGLKGAGQEALQETPQSGGEKYIENVTRKEYLDPSVNPMEGVLADAASGGAIGAFTGGVVGAGSAVNITQRTINKVAEAPTVDDAIKAATQPDPTLDDVIAVQTGATKVEPVSPVQQEAEVVNPNENVIVTPDGTRLNAVWDVVDADEVKASLTKGVNQPRDRKRAAANVQVQQIGNAPDYKRLRDSPVMDAGAPTLSLDNKIIAGNGRFEGVSLAYDQGTVKPYLDEMRADVISKGLDPAILEGKVKPILVRRLVDDHDVRKLAIKSNSGLSLDMSPIELASVDAERMVGVESLVLNELGEVALTPANMTTLKDVFNDYDAGEMNSMADKHLNLSQSGRVRIRNAMLAKAYGDSPTLEKLIESTDSDMRNVMSALVKSVGHVLKSKKDTTALLEAVDTYAQLKATGQPVDNFLAQQDAFSEGLSKEAEDILRFVDANARSQKKLTDFIKDGFVEVNTTSDDMFATPQKPLQSAKDERITKLETYLKDSGYDFTVEPASVRDVDALDSAAKAAEKIAKFFKKKVVFVKADGPFSINGVMVPSIADTIFIDIRTKKSLVAVMGHELSHWLEQDKPALYKQLIKSLKKVIKEDATKGYAKKYGIQGATEVELTKEIVGDIMGDNFTEQSFWDKVAKVNPTSFKDVAAAIIKWLKGVILKAKSQGMGSEEWVKDATKAQDILAKAVAQYTGENQSAGTEGGVKFSKFETGVPVTFNYLHNKESATKLFGIPKKDSDYDRGYEPSGKYVVATDSDYLAKQTPKQYEFGTLHFESPLVIQNNDLGWKKELSNKYGGLRGKNLSKAIIADGYDGVVTVDKYGTSEILDLTSFDEAKAKFSRAPKYVNIKLIDIDGDEVVWDGDPDKHPGRMLADDAIREVDDRIANLKRLIECLK